MARRVGMTTDVEERKKHWKSKYPNLTWRVVDSGLTYEQAQRMENNYISRGYKGSPGGEKKSGYKYSVYTFSY